MANSMPFYNLLINKRVGEFNVRISSFMIQELSGFDTGQTSKKFKIKKSKGPCNSRWLNRIALSIISQRAREVSTQFLLLSF